MNETVRYIRLQEVDSTNSQARQLLAQGGAVPEFTVVTAESQTRGRGQRGNSWESEPGQNLSFSIICHPNFLLASQQFLLSQAIALSVSETLADAIGVPCAFLVKWPNDIYYGDRKVSGTLIECDLHGADIASCIVGTGINVNQTVFRSDAPNPVSLRQITGRQHDREHLLKDVVGRFVHYYSMLSQGLYDDIRRRYRTLLYRAEGYHKYIDAQGEFEAVIHDIEPTGHLVLQRRDGSLSRYEFKSIRYA